jgi:hypothetical protein
MTDARRPLNVFVPGVQAGQLAEVSAAGPESQTVQVSPTAELVYGEDDTAYRILPGCPVQLVTGDSAIPLVDVPEFSEESDDEIYGLVLYNPKVSSWEAGDVLQVTTRGSVIWMTAGAEIDRGDKLALSPVEPEEGENPQVVVVEATSPTGYIGIALDDADQGDLVRVEVAVPLMTAPTS